MTMLTYIIIGIVAYLVFFAAIYKINHYLQVKKDDMKNGGRHPLIDAGPVPGWNPTHELCKKGVELFNLPFTPEENEIVYLENEYDVDANRFVKANIDLIRERLATRGLTFVYLPDLNVNKELTKSMIAYHAPQSLPDAEINIEDEVSLSSNFLLDYMVHPENRERITSSFAWYSRKVTQPDSYKTIYYYNFITFDGKEALDDPLGVIDDMLPELGITKGVPDIWFHIQEDGNDDTADSHFDDETQKILEEIKKQLDGIRKKGIAEAIIAKYVKPCPVLSHIRITYDFRIFLDDYNHLEIKMEPLVKAVYILFLRHENGIAFKDLADYGVELETIYRAIKSKRNDVDEKMASKLNTPVLSPNVQKLINPLDNSINEKCTRIKEAFIVHFHESIAENYFIVGVRESNKRITLPRNLIIWEDKA